METRWTPLRALVTAAVVLPAAVACALVGAAQALLRAAGGPGRR